MIYKSLDIFFLIFHTSIIIFNLFGWIWKKTRKANLILLLLTGFSWVGLGLFYGPGYCPFTDWHFRVLENMGVNDLPNSYVKYLVDRITGLSFDAGTVDAVTLYSYIVALILSLVTNFLTIRKLKLSKL